MARFLSLQQKKAKKNRLMRIKYLVGIGILLFALTNIRGVVFAQTGGDEYSFGIRPTKANEQRPETFSYFSFGLAPGAQVHDEALVINSGSDPVTLNIYAADGITAQNGGTAFTLQGNPSPGGSQDVSKWISLPINEITLAPGEEAIVPFILTIPANATPGHHVAGLVVESKPKASAELIESEGEAQFTVNVIHRVGVAVVIDVPGTHFSGLEINGIHLNNQDENGATFVLAVHNSGNVLLKAEGFLLITDSNLEPLSTLPLKLDTILPGDDAIFYITLPVELSDSDYLLHATLTYEGGSAFIENSEVSIRNGQPAIEGDAVESVLPPIITKIFSPNTSFNLGALIYKYKIIVFGFLCFLGVVELILFVYYFRYKKKGK